MRRRVQSPEDLVEDGVVFAELTDGLIFVGVGGVAGAESILHDEGLLGCGSVESAQGGEIDVGDAEAADGVRDAEFEGAPGEKGVSEGGEGQVEDEEVEVACVVGRGAG